jgi:hypothetical protein
MVNATFENVLLIFLHPFFVGNRAGPIAVIPFAIAVTPHDPSAPRMFGHGEFKFRIS